MLFKEIIVKKRDGLSLAPAEIQQFVDGLADGSLPAEQISSLAMAILLRGMNAAETGALTQAMARSGTMIDWREMGLDHPAVDKHSTGGIGDKISFILAPIIAACGGYVPMISGRGLGHTGGTLDKIAAIPGYDPVPGLDRFRAVVRECGCAIIGQTDDLAPADRRLYSIRDVTGTVESIPLITASILSKKVAAGNASLVMDVKVGTGAFMRHAEDARALSLSLIGAGREAGLDVHVLITDMNECLGTHAGNALEILESMQYLIGERRDPRLHEINLELAAQMLVLSNIASDLMDGRHKAQGVLDNGKAAESFGRMCAALGGPADFVERFKEYLLPAPIQRPVRAPKSGYVSRIDGRGIGNAIIALGGGRAQIHDELDLRVGFSDVAGMGAQIAAGDPLAMVHAATEADAERAIAQLIACFEFADQAPLTAPKIHARLSAADLS